MRYQSTLFIWCAIYIVRYESAPCSDFAVDVYLYCGIYVRFVATWLVRGSGVCFFFFVF